MSSHLDAIGVALIAAAILVIAVVALDRGYTRAARAQRATYHALRDRDRAAYWRLHHRYALLCQAGITVEQAAAEAEQAAAADEPIPYAPADRAAYLPVWTDDNANVAEYVQLRDASLQARQVTSW